VSILSLSAHAQSFLAGQDLSTVKVDALTNAEISQIQAQLKKAGVTIDMVESQVLAKGMSPAEFAKLKTRLSSNTATSSKSPLTKQTSSNKKLSDTTNKYSLEEMENEHKINPLIYGAELFNNTTGFKENENIATPMNYEVGANDVLKLVVFGVQEYSTDLTVSKEGSVVIENVGRVKVAGLTIEAATARVKQQMANTAYPSLRSGESKLALTVGDTRTIQVTVIGAQINGRDDISIEKKVQLEQEYMYKKSTLFDIEIIIKTFTNVLFSKGVSH
jgi:hypothetical protein